MRRFCVKETSYLLDGLHLLTQKKMKEVVEFTRSYADKIKEDPNWLKTEEPKIIIELEILKEELEAIFELSKRIVEGVR